MKQAEFEKKYSPFWSEIEKQLRLDFKEASLNDGIADDIADDNIKVKKNKPFTAKPGTDFPEDYRLICHHLSLARTRHYSPLLVERLEKLVINAHQVFYLRKSHLLSSILIYITRDFAKSIRKEWRWVLLSAGLFFGAFFSMLITLQFYPDMVYTVISAEQLAQMESMYDPSQGKIGRERNSGSDFQMFGFYIFNNTGIGLRTFASGLMFGIGTILTLIFNGLVIGGVAGYLTFIGYGSTFWPFVSGHSAMELSAIVLSGAAGFKIGFSIISPGRKSRLLSLRDSAKEAVFMMYGIAIMFIIAGFIEAYWSSMSDIPVSIKYSVGVFNWALLLAYFLLLGRSRR